ncbi:hypothetical protein EMCRGX_G017418 [Ephydatia muelleri]
MARKGKYYRFLEVQGADSTLSVGAVEQYHGLDKGYMLRPRTRKCQAKRPCLGTEEAAEDDGCSSSARRDDSSNESDSDSSSSGEDVNAQSNMLMCTNLNMARNSLPPLDKGEEARDSLPPLGKGEEARDSLPPLGKGEEARNSLPPLGKGEEARDSLPPLGRGEEARDSLPPLGKGEEARNSLPPLGKGEEARNSLPPLGKGEEARDSLPPLGKGEEARNSLPPLGKGEFIKYLGLQLAMTCEPKRGPIPVYWQVGDEPGSVYTGADFGGRFGMTRHRFQDIANCFSFTVPRNGVDPWQDIRPIIEDFNLTRQKNISPGCHLTVDECISAWKGPDGEYVAEGMPHKTKIARKPEGAGAEMKALACGEAGIILKLDVRKERFLTGIWTEDEVFRNLTHLGKNIYVWDPGDQMTAHAKMFGCFRCAEREEDEQQHHFSTFALMAKRVKPEKEKLILVPYFGPFAGHHLTFSILRGESNRPMLRVTVKSGESTISTFYHRSGRTEREGASPSFVDRCIKFAHDDSAAQKINTNAQPQSLRFLCKRAVILQSDPLPIHKLPRQVGQQFKGATVPLSVRVWRQNGASPSFVKLCVKPRISLAEVQWMLRHKVGYDAWPRDPAMVSFYDRKQPDQCLPLDTTQADHGALDCVVASTGFEATPSVVVSLMGRGLEQVDVQPDMTLENLDLAVRAKFRLSPHSFLYIPSVMRGRLRHDTTELKMYTPLNSSTAALISSNRTFPIVNGTPRSHMDALYTLDVYKRSVVELGLLNTSSILIIYEVTGPTITMPFRTIKGQENNLHTSNGRDSVFALVEEQVHVLSVNSSWHRDTLLKFIECLTGLPCDCA